MKSTKNIIRTQNSSTLPSVYFGTPFCDRQNKNLRFPLAAIDLPTFFFVRRVLWFSWGFVRTCGDLGNSSKWLWSAFEVPCRESWWMICRRHLNRKIAGSALERKLHARIYNIIHVRRFVLFFGNDFLSSVWRVRFEKLVRWNLIIFVCGKSWDAQIYGVHDKWEITTTTFVYMFGERSLDWIKLVYDITKEIHLLYIWTLICLHSLDMKCRILRFNKWA